MRDTTSDSAKTVQVELTDNDRVARRERSPIRSRSISSVLAITSRNLPVPAAHLSFMAKSATFPSGPSRITLLSCPPMSRTVSAPGKRCLAPRAWHVISVTRWSAPSADSLPYPVATVKVISSFFAPPARSAASNASRAAFRVDAPVAVTADPTTTRFPSSRTTSVEREPMSIPA